MLPFCSTFWIEKDLHGNCGNVNGKIARGLVLPRAEVSSGGSFFLFFLNKYQYQNISVGKKGQEIMFSSQRIFLQDYLRTFSKKELSFFLSEFILLPGMATSSINSMPRRRIFFILQCFFKMFHKSISLVELLETKQNMKKVLLIFRCASEHLKLT